MQQISVATITTWNQVMNQINKIEKNPVWIRKEIIVLKKKQSFKEEYKKE